MLLSCVWSLHILCVDLSTDKKFLNIFCHSLKTVSMWESNCLRYRSSGPTLFVRGALVYCCICQAAWTAVSTGVLCYSLFLSIEWWDNRCTVLPLALLVFWDLSYGPDADEHPQPLLPWTSSASPPILWFLSSLHCFHYWVEEFQFRYLICLFFCYLYFQGQSFWQGQSHKSCFWRAWWYTPVTSLPQEDEAGGLPWVWGQSSLHNEPKQASLTV